MAQLLTSVFVTDPETHHTVELAPGTCPEPKLAALVTNPAAWVDGELPDLEEAPDTGDGQNPAAAGEASTDGSDSAGDKKAAPAAKKPAAKKSAPAPARGRTAAGEGASGA
jgi:hypothetical protein